MKIAPECVGSAKAVNNVNEKRNKYNIKRNHSFWCIDASIHHLILRGHKLQRLGTFAHSVASLCVYSLNLTDLPTFFTLVFVFPGTKEGKEEGRRRR